MVKSRDPGFKFKKKFHFSPNSLLNFRKSYQNWGILAKEQKSYRQKTNWGGWKHPPAYRINWPFPYEGIWYPHLLRRGGVGGKPTPYDLKNGTLYKLQHFNFGRPLELSMRGKKPIDLMI